MMGRLLGALYPTPKRPGTFRSGVEVYFNVEGIPAAYVLADELAQHGALDLAEELSSFVRGIERELARDAASARGAQLPQKREKGVTTPTMARWRRLRPRLDHAITDIAHGVDFWAERALPYVYLGALRITLDRDGYDIHGKCWGVGRPLYNVTAIIPPDVVEWLATERPGTLRQHFHEETSGAVSLYKIVRADSADDAREQVARMVGFRTRSRV